MSRLLIIGYGNRLRGDDGAGPAIAGRLRERIPDPEIEILSLHQLTPELMDPISRADRVIFIDAAAGANPGEIAERPLHPDPGSSPFTHFATPEALLAGAQSLFGSAPPAILITITGECFDLREGLSASVQQALDSWLASPLRRA